MLAYVSKLVVDLRHRVPVDEEMAARVRPQKFSFAKRIRTSLFLMPFFSTPLRNRALIEYLWKTTSSLRPHTLVV
jgi:hypothetical protein